MLIRSHFLSFYYHLSALANSEVIRNSTEHYVRIIGQGDGE